MATGLLLLLAVGATFTGLLWQTPQHGGINCRQCVAQFDTFQRQLRVGDGPMSDEALASMQTHLRECDHCGPKFERRYPQAVQLFDAAGGAMLVTRHPAVAAILVPAFDSLIGRKRQTPE